MQREGDIFRFNKIEQRLTGLGNSIEIDELVTAVMGIRNKAAMLHEAAGMATPEDSDHVMQYANDAVDLEMLACKLEPHIPETAFEVDDDELSEFFKNYGDAA